MVYIFNRLSRLKMYVYAYLGTPIYRCHETLYECAAYH